MIHIEVWNNGGIFIPVSQTDRILLQHLLEGSPGFMAEEIEKATYLATAHNWQIDVVPEPLT